MSGHSKFSRCRVCGADITYDAALGLWTDRLGHPFCGQPPGGRLIPVSRPTPGAVRFPPAVVVTSDGPADGTGSARRLQALIAIGHSEARLASLLRHYGAPESERDIGGLVTPPSGAKVTVSRGTHDAICRLYDDLWDQAPPEYSPGERAATATARAQARRHDWPTPAALDDDLIDDPAYQPEAGWLPATLAGVPQHPFIAPPAPITRRRARCSEPARPARVTRINTGAPSKPSAAGRRPQMAPPPHDQDTTSWLQLLGAIEEAEAGRGTARLTEICLSVYGALAAAQFQVTQLRARVHALAATRPCPPGIPLCQRVRGYRAQPGPVSRNEENAMGLPASEKRVPDTIENELRITDQQLAGAFAAFTRSAGGTPMPGPERLSARHRFMTRLRGWRTGWLRLTAGGRGGTGTQQAPKSWPGSPAAPTEGRSRPGPGRMHHPRPHPADRVITS